MVGIFRSDTHLTNQQVADPLRAERARVGENWARRDVDSLEWDAGVLRQASASVPGPVAAVCAMVGADPTGLVAAFGAISLDPALVSMRVAMSSGTWAQLRTVDRLGVSLFSEAQGLVYRTMSARGGDRFSGVPWQNGDSGAVFVHGASLWVECAVHTEVDAGDLLIVLLAVHGVRVYSTSPPLVLHGRRHG